ncbi:hypothetical protein Gotri_021281 [Gossypium trilobum]|uniref:Uncharacterized protein n=1 Tax=Gossypium trilobum TaxID=34281 RepID=A0A7J9DC19_9ROSI|nr:hypothetical protein [Gossypium trilobum]
MNLTEDDVFLDDDEISIHEDDVEICLDGKYPEISFSKHVNELIDQIMKKTLIARLLAKTNYYSVTSQTRPKRYGQI